MRLVWKRSSSSISHTTTVKERRREERSGAEAIRLTAMAVVEASNGRIVTPEGEIKKENNWNLLQDAQVVPAPPEKKGGGDSVSFASALYWPH